MIIVAEQGSKDYLPWVRAELEPGRWPGEWWYEICYYDPDGYSTDGVVYPSWVHDWERDGGCFGFWRAVRKAMVAASDCWDALADEDEERIQIVARFRRELDLEEFE